MGLDRKSPRELLLSGYVARIEQARNQPWTSKDRRATLKEVNAGLDAVNVCLTGLLPDIRPIAASGLPEHIKALPRVRRALEILKFWDWMTTGQDDDVAQPVLDIRAMDRVISSAALPMWEVMKYRQAVGDAATRLNHFAQNRLGRHDISDKDLMAQAFTDKEPELGKPRFRCPGDQNNMSVRSMQQGALLMSQGVFQAIRNPAVHLPGDWNPVTAAEHLAALSIVARWVRHWDVVRVVPLPVDFDTAMAVARKSQKPLVLPTQASD